MLEIERVSWRKPHYVVRGEDGHKGIWERRRWGEAMTGEIDGHRFEIRRQGRKHFDLVSAGSVVANADAAKRRRWTISVGGSIYELRRQSARRSEMELWSGGIPIGWVRKGRALRGGVQCELPPELSPAVQAFIGFIALMLWNRAAARSGTAVVTSP